MLNQAAPEQQIPVKPDMGVWLNLKSLQKIRMGMELLPEINIQK